MRLPTATEHEEQVAFFEGVAWTYKTREDFLKGNYRLDKPNLLKYHLGIGEPHE